MKLARRALVLTIDASLAFTSAAGAATHAKAKAMAKPKPVCNLLTAPSGDATLVGKGDPSNDAIDIISGDIVANKKIITAVVRVKKLAKTSTMAPTGMQWGFGFTADEIAFTFAAKTDPTGAVSYQASYQDAVQGSLYSGGVSGTFDVAKSEIHITAPVSLLSAQATIKLGTRFTALNAAGSLDVVVPDPTRRVASGGTIEDLSDGLDSPTSAKTYVVGTASCVTPGV